MSRQVAAGLQNRYNFLAGYIGTFSGPPATSGLSFGNFYIDDSDDTAYYWDGTAWVALGGGGWAPPTTIYDRSAVVPPAAVVVDLSEVPGVFLLNDAPGGPLPVDLPDAAALNLGDEIVLRCTAIDGTSGINEIVMNTAGGGGLLEGNAAPATVGYTGNAPFGLGITVRVCDNSGTNDWRVVADMVPVPPPF
jgi:hypothetical protein